MPKFNNRVRSEFDQLLGGILGERFSGTSSPDAGGRPHRVPNNFAGHGDRVTLFVGVTCEPWKTPWVVDRWTGRPQALPHCDARPRVEPTQSRRKDHLFRHMSVRSTIPLTL